MHDLLRLFLSAGTAVFFCYLLAELKGHQALLLFLFAAAGWCLWRVWEDRQQNQQRFEKNYAWMLEELESTYEEHLREDVLVRTPPIRREPPRREKDPHRRVVALHGHEHLEQQPSYATDLNRAASARVFPMHKLARR